MKISRTFTSSLLNEAIGIMITTAVWQVASLFYPAYIIPSPALVLTNISTFLPQDFSSHLYATIYRVFAGFLMAFVIGTLIGTTASVSGQQKPVNSIMVALQVIPGTILGVIFLLMFGIGSATPILLVTFITLPILVINTVNGLSKRNIAQEQYLVSIKASRWQMIRYSYLPSLVSVLQSNSSLGMSMAVKVVILGEFIGSQNGLGYLLNNARIVFNMKEVFFYLMILMAFTILFQAAQSLFFSFSLRKYFYAE